MSTFTFLNSWLASVGVILTDLKKYRVRKGGIWYIKKSKTEKSDKREYQTAQPYLHLGHPKIYYHYHAKK